MTLAQLRKIINELPKEHDNKDIFIRTDSGDFSYIPAGTAGLKNIRFCESEENYNDEPYCDIECFVIDIV